MTETEWLACDDPSKMVKRARVGRRRKCRLFAVACCRAVWGLLVDERSRAAVEVAERHADGAATDEELRVAAAAANQAHDEMFRVLGKVGSSVEWAAAFAADANPLFAAKNVTWAVTHPRVLEEGGPRHDSADPVRHTPCTVTMRTGLLALALGKWQVNTVEKSEPTGAEHAVQVALIRDIFGNPFRPATLDPAWCSSTTTQLAAGIYDERAFDRLPILADALEEAGCADPDILAHCRGPGPHVRGCWVVDLLLGKS
jgi:hypothetical protein